MNDDDYARAADEAYEQRHGFDELEKVEVEVDPQVRSVVSVRFNRGELGVIEAAARAAGVPLSTYVRNCALRAATEAPAVDADQVRRAVDTIQRDLDLFRRQLGIAG
jgi:Mobilization protein NikA